MRSLVKMFIMNIMNWLAYVIWCVLFTEDPTNGTWLNFVPLAAKKLMRFHHKRAVKRLCVWYKVDALSPPSHSTPV